MLDHEMTRPADRCNARQVKFLALLLCVAVILRLWGTFAILQPLPLTDEGIHIANAVNLKEFGTNTNFNWQHPPLGGLIMTASISLLGNNPYGWRISNIIFGALSPLLLYLIGRRLYPSSEVPMIAASLLAFDPFHIYMSRTTFVEVPVSFFFLVYFYFIVKFTEDNNATLPLAGIALGLTTATKAYYAIAAPVLAAYAILSALKRGKPKLQVYATAAVILGVLPLAVTLLAYLQWFGRGFCVPEFWQMKRDALWLMQQFRFTEFINPGAIAAGGKPWEWFVRPIIFGQQLADSGTGGRFILEINNFPFRMLALPALAWAIARGFSKADLRELLAPALFISCYLLFLVVDRPMFSYSALVVLPLAWLIVGQGVAGCARWFGKPNQFSALFVLIVALWGLYCFPLVAGLPIRYVFYTPLLSITQILTGP